MHRCRGPHVGYDNMEQKGRGTFVYSVSLRLPIGRQYSILKLPSPTHPLLLIMRGGGAPDVLVMTQSKNMVIFNLTFCFSTTLSCKSLVYSTSAQRLIWRLDESSSQTCHQPNWMFSLNPPQKSIWCSLITVRLPPSFECLTTCPLSNCQWMSSCLVQRDE